MGRVDPITGNKTMLSLQAARTVGGATIPFLDSTEVSRACVEATLREVRANDAGESSASIHLLSRARSIEMELPFTSSSPEIFLAGEDLVEEPSALDVKRAPSLRRRPSAEIASESRSPHRWAQRSSSVELGGSGLQARTGQAAAPRRGSSVELNPPLSLTQLYRHMKTRVDQRVREV